MRALGGPPESRRRERVAREPGVAVTLGGGRSWNSSDGPPRARGPHPAGPTDRRLYSTGSQSAAPGRSPKLGRHFSRRRR